MVVGPTIEWVSPSLIIILFFMCFISSNGTNGERH